MGMCVCVNDKPLEVKGQAVGVGSTLLSHESELKSSGSAASASLTVLSVHTRFLRQGLLLNVDLVCLDRAGQ